MIASQIRWALLALVVTAAVFDWRWRRIPNWLVSTGAVAAFVLHIWLGGLEGLKTAASGFAVALAVYIPLFALRSVGGGDVKLMAAAGAFLGAHNWLLLFLISSLLGGVMALALVIWKGKLGATLGNVGLILAELAHLRAPHRRREDLDIRHPEAITLPRGVVIAVSTILLLLRP